MGLIDALQGNVFYSMGPYVLLVCVIYHVSDISVSGNKALVFQAADGDDQYAFIALIRKVADTHKHHHK